MKRLLFLFDTDQMPSTFDTVVGYDGGADEVIGYGGVSPANVGNLVDGTIFTRGPDEKQLTAIFVGGSDMAAGEALLAAIKTRFFANFRVSVMLDSNGSNTTAAAAVAQLAKARPVGGKRAVVLAGTGPVGMRAAALLAREGADVVLTSREARRAEQACQAIASRFGVSVRPAEAADDRARAAAIQDAQIVVAGGAIGVPLLQAQAWQDFSSVELIADCNAQPPLGIAGIKATDRATERCGKVVFGALGVGSLKLKLHRALIARLFERADQILDAEEVFATAKEMSVKSNDSRPIAEFVKELASGSPTPGGGSAAALMGALGAALVSMVCHITSAKRTSDPTERELEKILSAAEKLVGELTALIDEDARVFEQVMRAYAMPRQSPAEAAARREAIQATLKTATLVPLQCCEACHRAIELSGRAAVNAHRNVISDAGVAVVAANAGLRSAALNVFINARSIDDKNFVAAKLKQVQELLADAGNATEATYALVRSKLE